MDGLGVLIIIGGVDDVFRAGVSFTTPAEPKEVLKGKVVYGQWTSPTCGVIATATGS